MKNLIPEQGKLAYNNVPPLWLGAILSGPWTPVGWMDAGPRTVIFPLLPDFSFPSSSLFSFILLFVLLLEGSGKTYTNCHAECVVC